MKYYYYVYYIDFLKIDYALLLDENKFLYPYNGDFSHFEFEFYFFQYNVN